MVEIRLRELGVYLLPNGRRLTARKDRLFPRVDTDSADLTYYEINVGGRLVNSGKLTAWDVSDLTDTGTTANESSLQ